MNKFRKIINVLAFLLIISIIIALISLAVYTVYFEIRWSDIGLLKDVFFVVVILFLAWAGKLKNKFLYRKKFNNNETFKIIKK